jgi:hypothetical protein
LGCVVLGFRDRQLRQARVVVAAQAQVGSHNKQAGRNSGVQRLMDADLRNDRIHLLAILARGWQRLPRAAEMMRRERPHGSHGILQSAQRLQAMLKVLLAFHAFNRDLILN